MSEKIQNLLEEIKDLNLNHRLIKTSEFFVGYPYIRGNTVPAPDETDLNITGFDCMTYVETCLALSLCHTFNDFLPTLYYIRYYNSKPDISYRKHFAYLDWLKNNNSVLEERIELEGSIATITKKINRERFFKLNNIPLLDWMKKIEKIQIPYLPSLSEIVFADDIYVVLFVSNNYELDIKHMGFIIQKDGPFLRHASSKYEKVVDEDFYDYLYSTDTLGIVLATLNKSSRYNILKEGLLS